jgi:hypothetical protein
MIVAGFISQLAKIIGVSSASSRASCTKGEVDERQIFAVPLGISKDRLRNLFL